MTVLQQLISLYLDAHPSQRADTEARVQHVVELGEAEHTAWALLPVRVAAGDIQTTELTVDDGSTTLVPVLELAAPPGLTTTFTARPRKNVWVLPDLFGMVYPSSNNITMESFTYTPAPGSPDFMRDVAFRLHRLSGPELPLASYPRAVTSLRTRLAEIESTQAQFQTELQNKNSKAAAALRQQLKSMNAIIMARRYKMVIDFVDLLLQTGAFDESVEVSATTGAKFVTVEERVTEVLKRVQGCPSFEPVCFFNVPRLNGPVSAGVNTWQPNFLVVPRLSDTLYPLPKLLAKKCTLSISEKLDFMLALTRMFKELVLCILRRNVVWLTPRLDVLYANLDSARKVQYLVAPATQVYNMFAVSQLPPDVLPPLRAVLEEFVIELFYTLAAPNVDPWDTLDVTNLKVYDFTQLMCEEQRITRQDEQAWASFSDMLPPFKTALAQLMNT